MKLSILNSYKNGGTHETNPYGGIPLGNATVEEGETAVNLPDKKYIFSDRIDVMDSDILKDFNLPSYLKDKTFAKASEAIEGKFKDRFDKQSRATKAEMLDRLSKAQDHIKTKNDISSFAEGGDISPYISSIGGGVDMLSDALIDDPVISGTLDGVTSGAAAGATFGPLGAGIGGLLGGGLSLLKGSKAKEEAQDAMNSKALSDTKHLRSDFKHGGKMYDKGGPFDIINPLFTTTPTLPAGDAKVLGEDDFNKVSTGAKLRTGIGRGANWLGENFGNIMQYAPIAGNLNELNKLDKPVTRRGDRLGNKYEKDLFNTQSLINQINNNNVNRALEESSTGNLGALRSNILAANANKNRAISDALIKGDQINRDEGRFEFQSDFNRDRINTQLDLNYLNRQDADQGAYESARSNLRQQLFSDIGDIGREEVNKKLVREMFGYKWNGKYFVDDKGKEYTQAEVAKKIKQKRDGSS